MLALERADESAMATEVAAAEEGVDGEVGAERVVWYE